MTHTDYTKNILNIKDNNIYFYENCLETRKDKNAEVKIFHGYLTYIPDYCEHCGCINEGHKDIIKWAFDKNCLVKLPKVSNFNTILLLDKQRFYCKNCNSTFTAKTSLVDFHKQISNNTKLSVILCVKSNPNYKKLKKYWKLILKDKRELNREIKKYQNCFKKEMSQYDIVTYLINTNQELYETYQVYQSILYSIDIRNKDIFKSIINGKNIKISKYMKRAIKTFKNMEFYILNSFDYEYSNGIVEGTNNVIKQIKHTACGYRKFKHFKARIMLIKGLLNPIKT